MNVKLATLSFALALAIQTANATDACNGVGPKQVQEDERLDAFASTALQHPSLKVDLVFTKSNWRILRASAPDADQVYIFTSSTQATTAAAIWAGAARRDEASDIQRWAVEHAPGIPLDLARCFAAYVTGNAQG